MTEKEYNYARNLQNEIGLLNKKIGAIDSLLSSDSLTCNISGIATVEGRSYKHLPVHESTSRDLMRELLIYDRKEIIEKRDEFQNIFDAL